MQLPNLTHDQIRSRCTEQSFTRGEEYFDMGMIGNPVLHGWTLASTCEGTEEDPYHVSVELMPTGIAATECSCPYSYEGDCKHIVALLLTYIHAPDVICSLDVLMTALAEKPKETLLRVVSELLKRTPELVPVARFYADVPEEPDAEVEPILSELSPYVTIIDEEPDVDPIPTTHEPAVSVTVTTYREQVDRLFGNGFLEQQQLHQVLGQLEGLVAHAESLARTDEMEFALSVLHAVIHQSITRYSDTLQRGELPRFVNRCTKTFAEIATAPQESEAMSFSTEIVPATLLEHCRMLLQLSFNAEAVFVPILTGLLEQVCTTLETTELQTMIEQHLDESPDRQAHVRLLLALYAQANKIEDYLRVSQSEGENYRLILALFTHQHDNAAWKSIEEFPLSVDEYWRLLQSPIAKHISRFTERLFGVLRHRQSDITIALYQKFIEQIVLSRKQEDYQRVQKYLIDLKELYQHLDQEDQWTVYLTDFRKRHSRKRLLLRVIAEI